MPLQGRREALAIRQRRARNAEGPPVWWVRTTVKTDALPAGRTVIHFRFRGAPAKPRYFLLVLPEADLCLTDPGFGVDITVSSDPKTMTAVWETSA